MKNEYISGKKALVEKELVQTKSRFLDFLTPAMATESGMIVAALLSLPLLFIILLFDFLLPLNSVSGNLLLLGMSQLIGFFIVKFGFIPLFRSKEIVHESVNTVNFRKMIMGITIVYSMAILSNIILISIFNSFDSTPQSGYGSILITKELLNDPLTLTLYFLVPTLGAGVFEELVYRRMVIPLLEERGMAPKSAALASAFIFALSHLPNDLINGNLSGGIVHVWGVFLIGTMMGLIYVLTRNIIYPIIMHATVNFISFLGPYVLLSESLGLLILYELIVFALIGVGSIFGVYLLIQYFRHSDKEWIQMLKTRSLLDIKKGFLGYMIITTVILTALVTIDITFTIILISGFNEILTILLYSALLGIILTLLLWVGYKNRMKAIRQGLLPSS